MELLQLILSAIAQAFTVSQISALNREIVDGGTKNRVWSFLTSVILIPISFAPIALLFPTFQFGIITYPLMAFSGLINYVASIAHQNQIYIHAGEPDKIIKLRLGLQNNRYLMKAALFLSRNLYFMLTSFFIATLVICIFLGAPVYAYLSLAMYAANLLNQHGYMPAFLRNPYLYLNIAICIFAVFGVTSWLAIGLSTALVAFTVYDYIHCYLWKKESPTAQFPMADPTKILTLPEIAENDPVAIVTLKTCLNAYRKSTERRGIHVTFNHFYQSHQIIERVLSDVPFVYLFARSRIRILRPLQ